MDFRGGFFVCVVLCTSGRNGRFSQTRRDTNHTAGKSIATKRSQIPAGSKGRNRLLPTRISWCQLKILTCFTMFNVSAL